MRQFFLSIVLLCLQMQVFAHSPMSFDQDGQKIINDMKSKYWNYQVNGYQHPPGVIPFLMASALFNPDEINQKTLLISRQHGAAVFDNIARFIDVHICASPTGKRLCHLYHDKVSIQSSSFKNNSFGVVLSQHIALAISSEEKSLDSWSSNYVMWLFINPNNITVNHLARMIIHEMYQAIDPKNSVKGVVALFKTKPMADTCSTLGLNLNLGFRFASSALRALKIEDQVMQEITGQSNGIMTVVNSLSCESQLNWANEALRKFQARIVTEMFTGIISTPEACYNDQRTKDKSATFDQAVARALETRGQCKYMIEPNLQEIEFINLDIIEILDTWFHGPRPRIGGV